MRIICNNKKMNFDWDTLLKKFKLKKTTARIEILNFLKNQSQPSLAEEIFAFANKDQNNVDLATIYRTLKIFVDLKIIKTIDLKEGKLRYELMGHHHHHLVCQNCGKITPIYDCCLEKIQSKIEKQNHFIINYHSLEFFGLCQKCQ